MLAVRSWRSSDMISSVMIGLCIAAMTASVRALRQEYSVAEAQRATVAELASDASLGEPAFPDNSSKVNPRLQIALDQRLVLVAIKQTDASRRHVLLDHAVTDLKMVLGERLNWSDALIALAFAEAQRSGSASPQTLAALTRSYAAAPFSRDAAAWRVRTGIAAWSAINEPLRAHIIDEAVWLTSTSFDAQQAVTQLIRGTPPYQRFMRRWYEFRTSGIAD